MTDYERIGGAAELEVLITAFIDRVYADFIIGFLFIGKDRERIIRHEIEHASAHLGGPSEYRGRPMPAVHKPLKINAGHFRRRLAILRTVLLQHQVDHGVIDRWISANQRLESSITDGTECLPEGD